MQRSPWLREPRPQGSPIQWADPQQASPSEPVGPYCLLPTPGAPQPIALRPAPASPNAPTLAWSRSHGDS